MEAQNLMKLFAYLSVAGAAAAVILPCLLSLTKRENAPRHLNVPFLWFTGLSLLTGVAASFGFQAALATDPLVGTVWLAGLLGTGIGLVCILVSGHLLRTDAPVTQQRWNLVLMAGSGAGLAAGSYSLLRHSSRVDEWLLCLLGGIVITTATFTIASALISSQVQGSKLPKLASVGAFAGAVAAGICLLCILTGKLHFENNNRAGEAGVLFLCLSSGWTALMLVLASTIAKRILFLRLLAWVMALTGCCYLAWLTTQASGLKFEASVCIWAGLGIGTATGLVQVSGMFSTASGYRTRAGFFILTAIISAAALSLRELGGFGVIMMTAGIIAGALAVSCTGIRNEDLVDEADAPVVFLWTGSLFIVFGALRVWMTGQGYQEIPIFTPYPFIGLVVGLALPGLVLSIANEQSSDRASTTATSIGGTLLVLFFCAASIALALVILREPALRIFLAGLAGGLLPTWRHVQTVSRDTAATAMTAVCTSVVTITLANPLMNWTQFLERQEKVKWIAIIFIIAAALYAVFEVLRFLTARRKASYSV